MPYVCEYFKVLKYVRRINERKNEYLYIKNESDSDGEIKVVTVKINNDDKTEEQNQKKNEITEHENNTKIELYDENYDDYNDQVTLDEDNQNNSHALVDTTVSSEYIKMMVPLVLICPRKLKNEVSKF